MVKFSLAAALKSSDRKPFSNRSVERKVCKEVYWSYALKRGLIRWREGLFEEGAYTEETYRGN